MSIFAVDRVSRDVLHDPAFRERLLREPEAALEGRDLTPEERGALLAGDVGALYALGANAYLMGNLFRFGAFGLTLGEFNRRMRAVAPVPDGHGREPARSQGSETGRTKP